MKRNGTTKHNVVVYFVVPRRCTLKIWRRAFLLIRVSSFSLRWCSSVSFFIWNWTVPLLSCIDGDRAGIAFLFISFRKMVTSTRVLINLSEIYWKTSVVRSLFVSRKVVNWQCCNLGFPIMFTRPNQHLERAKNLLLLTTTQGGQICAPRCQYVPLQISLPFFFFFLYWH